MSPTAPLKIRSKWLATAAVVGAVALVLTACTGTNTKSAPKISGFGDKTLATTTKAASGPIDSFTWNLPFGEPTSLDPILSYNNSENTVLSNVCDSLLRYAPDRKIVPGIAESYTNPTPTTWVYKIRSDVHYFNGNLLTPADVVYNLERSINPDLGSYYNGPFGSQIASVEQTGPDEVTMTTKTPNTLINGEMVTGLGTIVDPKSIEAQGKDFGTSSGTLNCTGAFELDKWVPGDSITLKKNPNYWDKDLQPKASTIKFSFITDQVALSNALLAGEVDGSYEVPVRAVNQLRNSKGGSFYLGTSLQQLDMYFFGNAVTNNVKIRQALNILIDRAAIAKTAYANTALPIKSMLNPDASNYGKDVFAKYYKDLPTPGPDLAKAKKLIKEAGAPKTAIRLAIQAGDPAQADTAASIQSSAKEAGLKVDLVTVPGAEYSSIYYGGDTTKKNYDAVLAVTYYDFPDINGFYALALLPGVIPNISGFDNPTFNAAFAKAVAETNDTKRAEYTVEEAQQIDKDLPYLALLETGERLYMNKKIAGAPATFPYLYYPWAALVGSGN